MGARYARSQPRNHPDRDRDADELRGAGDRVPQHPARALARSARAHRAIRLGQPRTGPCRGRSAMTRSARAQCTGPSGGSRSSATSLRNSTRCDRAMTSALPVAKWRSRTVIPFSAREYSIIPLRGGRWHRPQPGDLQPCDPPGRRARALLCRASARGPRRLAVPGEYASDGSAAGASVSAEFEPRTDSSPECDSFRSLDNLVSLQWAERACLFDL